MRAVLFPMLPRVIFDVVFGQIGRRGNRRPSASMDIDQALSEIGERSVFVLGKDSVIQRFDIDGSIAALFDDLSCLVFPPGEMREDVLNRVVPSDAGFRCLLVSQADYRRQKFQPFGIDAGDDNVVQGLNALRCTPGEDIFAMVIVVLP